MLVFLFVYFTQSKKASIFLKGSLYISSSEVPKRGINFVII
jgi:hypothetical protein